MLLLGNVDPQLRLLAGLIVVGSAAYTFWSLKNFHGCSFDDILVDGVLERVVYRYVVILVFAVGCSDSNFANSAWLRLRRFVKFWRLASRGGVPGRWNSGASLARIARWLNGSARLTRVSWRLAGGGRCLTRVARWLSGRSS